MSPVELKWLDMARIDIKNQGDGNDVKVTVLVGKNCHITQPQWFAEGGIGCVVETADKYQVLELECKGTGKLMIRLRGLARYSYRKKRLPLWVDYTRLAVNEDTVFWELKPLWHDKSYFYYRDVMDGEKIRLEFSWSQHGYKGDELFQLISLCCS